ncbi:hypothetical protein HDEF_0779 [Candidatus Hamiltonella defensa 5AT (Acyrthosiphon pisum)]|uniref:Uncharacterized protein n=1 Tax=Hamiltonella defensa subsp. Acyrthosiphon pisum (strain 5AT) TaxID=572265 RepID=C4K4L3_HAMD5|nr:hypothetical protein HDEF_0779 [Candidatus Hamiltonella defensa 5AT (Acyrthosiphon pisum)]
MIQSISASANSKNTAKTPLFFLCFINLINPKI